MMPMTVGEAAQALAGTLMTQDGLGDGAITSVVTDSRQVEHGSLFVAIAGEHVDGHNFVSQVGESGAVAALVDHAVPDTSVPQIVVPDTVIALGQLAKANLDRRRANGDPFTIVGITGSVGKTTTKDLLHALLKTEGKTIAPVGSFNNDIGLPLTALKVSPDTRFLVAEMGANHMGEIANLATIARPDIAVVLKVGVAHLGEFGSVENIQQAKSEIIRALNHDGEAVLNADDEHVVPMAELAPGRVYWFGQGERAQIRATEVHADAFDRASFVVMLPQQDKPVSVTLAIPGHHNVMNALAAITVAWRLGVPVDRIVSVLAKQSSISPHRMAVSQLHRDGVSFTVIDDSFNANPDSMRAGIDGLAGWAANGDAGDGEPFRIAVLGSMLELGGDEAELHRQIGAYAVECGIDAVIGVGSSENSTLDSLAGDIVDGVQDAAAAQGREVDARLVHQVNDADDCVMQLAREHAPAVVLLKGSHASGLSALAARWDALREQENASHTTSNQNGATR